MSAPEQVWVCDKADHRFCSHGPAPGPPVKALVEVLREHQTVAIEEGP